MRYNYETNGTCSKSISFDLDGDVVRNIEFTRGCNGSLKAIAALVDGWTVSEIAEKCENIVCSGKSTSCAGELAKAVMEAQKETAE